jgi:hypothetical protein
MALLVQHSWALLTLGQVILYQKRKLWTRIYPRIYPHVAPVGVETNPIESQPALDLNPCPIPAQLFSVVGGRACGMERRGAV